MWRVVQQDSTPKEHACVAVLTLKLPLRLKLSSFMLPRVMWTEPSRFLQTNMPGWATLSKDTYDPSPHRPGTIWS